MIMVQDQKKDKHSKALEHYESLFHGLNATCKSSEPSWLEVLRRNAFLKFSQIGFPTTKTEAWKYTNVSEIETARFQNVQRGSSLVVKEEFDQMFPFSLNGTRLVFVNGFFAEHLSILPNPQDGVVISSLDLAIKTHPEILKSYLTRETNTEDVFATLNKAFIQDGVFVYVPQNLEIKNPIHLIFIQGESQSLSLVQPRNLIVIGPRSRASIIETFFSVSEHAYFTNGVTEMVAEEGATLRYGRVQAEGKKAYHVYATNVQVGKESSFSSLVLDLGAKIARHNLNVELLDVGASCNLNGLYFPRSGQHMDHHTSIQHQKPEGVSRQLYKGILSGASQAVFCGNIFVAPGAQKTDAAQANKNLLLSSEATIDTKPQLEIFADDVKCTHGAAIGELDPTQVFYLKSRGISELKAKEILSLGFAVEVLNHAELETTHEYFETLVKNQFEGNYCEK